MCWRQRRNGTYSPVRVSPANNTSVSERDEVRYAIIMTRGEPWTCPTISEAVLWAVVAARLAFSKGIR